MFSGLATAVLAPLLLVSAATVAAAGGRLSRLAAALTERTRLGSAFVGVVVLGSATSLPELATTTTATVVGDAGLAVGNLVGGVAALMALLAAADAALPGSLAARLRLRTFLVKAGFLASALALVLAGLLLPPRGILGMGAWTLALLAAYPLMLWAVRRLPSGDEPPSGVEGPIWGRMVGAAAIILASGVVFVLSAEELAARHRLDSSFVGATLLAWTTALPEASSTWGAMRLGRADLAAANVVGAGFLQLVLLAVVDAGTKGHGLLETGSAGVALATLSLVLVGLLAISAFWRRQPSMLRLGVGSWAVLAVYVAGMTWFARW